MTSKSTLDESRARRQAEAEEKRRVGALNELVGLYIQLSDAPASERAQLRQAIYETAGVSVTAVDNDTDKAGHLIT